jgi:hypothetical protein
MSRVVEKGFRIEYNTEKLTKAKIEVVELTMLESMIVIASDAKLAMSRSPRGGRTYKSRGGSGRDHTASAKGEAPAVDLGELLNSVRGTAKRIGDLVVGMVGAQVGGVGVPLVSGFPIWSRFSVLESPEGLDRPSVAPAWAVERPKLVTRLRKNNERAAEVK